MAKTQDMANKVDVKEFLASLEALPPVYNANEFTNRPFTLIKVDWKIFDPTPANNYRSNEKIIMTCQEISSGKMVVLESTQKGIVQPIAKIEEHGYFPCDLMIIQEGKFCSVVAR